MRQARDSLAGLVVAAAALLVTGGCFGVRGSSGGGQTAFEPPRRVDVRDVIVPDGYRVEIVASDLTYPTGVAFDDHNRPHVVESGYAYGEDWAEPRLVRIEPDGGHTVVARGANGPWNGVAFHDGQFYVAQGGVEQGGRIVRINPADGNTTTLIENLPSLGDHHTNGPVIGSDGYAYFGVGTATNSGVVGTDNASFGWLKRHPTFHDIPAKDVTLAGRNFNSKVPTGLDVTNKNGVATTGAFSPYGHSTSTGEVIKGEMPCTGAILRVPLAGGRAEPVAWGLRNPFGLAWSTDGALLVTENSYDVRGSRPIFGSGDVLWRIDPKQPGVWYGWPDFHAGQPITRSDMYQAPGHPRPQFLLAEHPNDPPDPLAVLGVHAAAGGLDVSRGETFGYAGHAFIAEFGDLAPAVGKVLAPVGYRVARVDLETGTIHAFAVNRGRRDGPASKIGGRGLERPVDVQFSPAGDAMYVVDFGVVTVRGNHQQPRKNTGVLWRITRETGDTSATTRGAAR